MFCVRIASVLRGVSPEKTGSLAAASLLDAGLDGAGDCFASIAAAELAHDRFTCVSTVCGLRFSSWPMALLVPPRVMARNTVSSDLVSEAKGPPAEAVGSGKCSNRSA